MLVQIGDIYPLVGTAAFSISAAIIRKLDEYGTAVQLNFIRTFIGGVAFLLHLLIVGYFLQLSQLSLQIFGLLVLSVLFNVVLGDSTFFEAQKRIGVKIAMPLVNTYPLITILFAAIWLGEDASLALVLGAIIIINGVILLSLDTTTQNKTNPEFHHSSKYIISGLIITIIAMLFYVFGFIFTTVATEGLNPIVANSVRLPSAAILLFALVLAQNPKRPSRSVEELDGMDMKSNKSKKEVNQFFEVNIHAPRKIKMMQLIAGLLGTYLSSIFLVLSVQAIGASRSAVLFSTGPLFSLPIAIYWLKEKASWKALFGTILTIIGLWIILL